MSISNDPNNKAVMVLSPNLEKGPAANRAACLATGLIGGKPEMIGPDLITKDGQTILGFTQIPIPILTCKPEQSLLEMADKAKNLDCAVYLFLTRAQGMRSYEEYKVSVAQTNYADLDVDGIAIYGPNKVVNSVTGSLPMLR
jgi:hypothetical protein